MAPSHAKVATAVYRCWSSNDVLLYVGISKHPWYRMTQHAGGKDWWFLVDQDRDDWTWHADRRSALIEEAHAIATEFPLFNISMNDGRNAPWERMLYSNDRPALSPLRIPQFAEAALFEPDLLVVLKAVMSFRNVCGECVWPDVLERVRPLVGFDAPLPTLRQPRLYEAVVSTLYEALPWAVCELCGAA